MSVYDVAIVGGGPAGAAAAIALAQAGHSVLLLEAKPIPHEKLCGEFLSPECQSLLAQLGASQAIESLHPVPIRDARVIAADGTHWRADLPGDGWGLSRYRFDFALLEEAIRQGARVRDMQVCIRVGGDLRDQFEIKARHTRTEAPENYRARVVVSAHGKRSTMDRLLQRDFLGKTHPLFAVKRHFRGAPPDGVVLHALAGGYCGLAPVEDDTVNLCFLADERAFRTRDVATLRQTARERVPVHGSTVRGRSEGMNGDTRIRYFLAHMARANPALGEWLRSAVPAGDQWLSVGALAFGARGCVSHDVLLVGDAAGLIAPLAGDGIGMALRSGLLCARLSAAFLQGAASAEQLKARYRRAWNAEFLPRIRLAGALQGLALSPRWLRATLRLFQRVPALGRWAVRHTRGS